MTNKFWEIKLTAWLHDPAEKCFVLFHDPSGHEGGSIKNIQEALKEEIGLETGDKEKDIIKKADWIASSADRPQWPKEVGGDAYEKWAQVDFASEPELIHPLTGDILKLEDLQGSVSWKELKDVSEEYFKDVLKLGKDAKMKFLAMWRFAPETPKVTGKSQGGNIGKLWQLLPADTRVPDHSIWNHLDLTSAFAGSLADDEPALLAVTFGPVQSFIAQARSTSDLWAGSHLLSSIVWEGMKAVAEEVGPDSFLFPQIRGVPAADLWLLDMARDAGCEDAWRRQFENAGVEWLKSRTDSNPLFAASLPNKFSAIVPKSKVESLVEKIKASVWQEVKMWTEEIPGKLGFGEEGYFKEQMEEQLKDFPNIYWASVDWPTDTSEENLEPIRKACDKFFEESDNFFNKDYWKILNKEIPLGGKTFYKLQAGVLYPAVYQLSEKALAASKTARSFEQLTQTGFRCTLCGEREWLAEKKEQLNIPANQREKSGVKWAEKAGRYGIKKGEYLCAVCALKRFWPTIFLDKVKDYTASDDITRYVVSTHAMALAPTLRQLGKIAGEPQVFSMEGIEIASDIEKIQKEVSDCEPVVLPHKLYVETIKADGSNFWLKRIPGRLEELREEGSENKAEEFEARLAKVLGKKEFRPETYYALLLMDGDKMGAWLSGDDEEKCIKYSDSWHSKIRSADVMKNGEKAVKDYLDSLKPASQGKHAVISGALNSFSGIMAPYIVEKLHCGKLIYSGGDDVLAMSSTDDILGMLKELRLAYSGIGNKPENAQNTNRDEIYKQNGFALLKNRLMQTMGKKATVSAGVVIAHHKMPLAYALKCLREAESMAKSAGRNAFCIRILKRAGGEVSYIDHWWSENSDVPNDKILTKGFDVSTPIGLFEKLVEIGAALPRKAFYALEDWVGVLSVSGSKGDKERTKEMAEKMLSQQLSQHGCEKVASEENASTLAKSVVEMAWRRWNEDEAQLLNKETQKKSLEAAVKYLENMLYSAEFFARETRNYAHKKKEGEDK
ncbi:MAG: type III-B CRISPR-associated protein Cas10/Cmr2 [Candidatus Riflebacteria bacterium]|nr:type III-B CRISPR-associated protein Cas10/Cmr2 [Candidatus Riflebacteria bacterium]